MENKLDHLGFPARNFSDLYPRWLAARELLLNKRDPYSQPITREIQQGYYGRAIDERNHTDPVDEQRFAYPLFVIFLLAPTVFFPFSIVKILFTFLLLASAIGTAFLWIKFTRWNLRLDQQVLITLMTLASLPYLEGMEFQQLSILVALFVAFGLWLLAKDQLVMAGVLLSLSTIKPQLSLPIICWVFLGAIAEWRSRKTVIFAFAASLIVQLTACQILLPGWFAEFLRGLGPYLRYTRANTGLAELIGKTGAGLLILASGCLVIRTMWHRRSTDIDSTEFILMAVFLLAFTCAIIPSLAPQNQVLVIPAYYVLINNRKTICGLGRIPRSLFLGVLLLAAWPFIIGVLLALQWLFSRQELPWRYWNLPLATNPLIPMVVLIALIPLFGSRARPLVPTDS